VFLLGTNRPGYHRSQAKRRRISCLSRPILRGLLGRVSVGRVAREILFEREKSFVMKRGFWGVLLAVWTVWAWGEPKPFAMSGFDFGELRPGGDNVVRCRLVPREKKLKVCCTVLVLHPKTGKVVGRAKKRFSGDGEGPVDVSVPYSLEAPGEFKMVFLVQKGKKIFYHESRYFRVNGLDRADYGACLSSSQSVSLWWCDATRKVGLERPLPQKKSDAVRVSAAKGEYQPFQLVVHPNVDLKNLQVSVSDLLGPGDPIPSEDVSISRVAYLEVKEPSDPTGSRGWWPDPLPEVNPLGEALCKGKNHPFWITVWVASNRKAGEYKGEVRMSAGGWFQIVPLRLRVWDFALPTKPSIRSAFGVSPGTIWNYQHVQPEKRRAVWDLYMKNFKEHRISPYQFWLDDIQVSFSEGPNGEICPELDFEAWDREAEKYLDGQGFAGYRLPIQGTGSGTFHSRSVGSLAGHMAGSAQYEKAFRRYVRGLSDHLEKKGWLDEAYVYWFDEPTPRDYDFLKEVMKRLKNAAPKLKRMLTEEPVEPLFGAVDIWCPILNAYDPQICRDRQKLGEEIWWYVCTGPKAPYPGLFIDRDAIEMRIWLWMTQKFGVEGILVWQTMYWTSGTAFPGTLQDPWEDPMGYQTGYGLASGKKLHWGNGDGRFLYPANRHPLEDQTEYVAGPVNSIRWEMLREGLEDVEYFRILEKELDAARKRGLPERKGRKGEALLLIGDDFVEDLTHFTREPDQLYERRERIARFIEHLKEM